MKLAFLLNLLMAVLLFGQAPAVRIGERITYRAGFRLLSVGTATMTMDIGPGEDGAEVLKVLSRVRTDPFFDRLYKINDRVEIHMDPATLETVSVFRNINEGKYHRVDSARVFVDQGKIHTLRDTLQIDGPVYDPIGGIYYLREQSFTPGEIVPITVFDGRRLRQIGITQQEKVTIKVPAGQFECLVLVPVSLDERQLTKVGGFLKIWLTDDERRIPVRLEQKTNFGTMVLKMSEYESGERR